MIVRTINDNNIQIEKESLSDIKNLVNKIVDKSLKKLQDEGIFVFPEVLKDAEDLDDEQFILKSYNGYYISSNIMGFIGYGQEELVIKSRFSNDNNGHDYFLEYLLSKVLDIPNIVDLETNANNNNKLFNYLLFLFPFYLKQAIRKGLFKQYEKHEYNNENIKGTIDIARHIKSNVPFIGKIAYLQREFSYDNDLVELIRHTIEYIKTFSYGSQILNKVSSEVKQIIEVTKSYSASDRNKLISKNFKHPIKHAYYKEYHSLQQLCLLILTNKSHSIGQGQKKIYGIIFDGSWLWEEYLNILIKDNFYHPKNKASKGGQWLFTNNKSKEGLIFPDFIGKNLDNRIIADAKYKPLGNIKNKDYLQLLAYMFRFDCKKGYFLYPEASDSNSITLNLNKGVSYEKNVESRQDISIIKLGLKIPKESKDYNDFAKAMDANGAKFAFDLIYR